jgi:5'-3' exonuclease
MRTSAGLQTEAVYIFHNMVRKLRAVHKPEYIAAIFESLGKTFRDEAFAEYKANRTETPPDLLEQVPWIRKTLEAMRIPVLEYDGFEADDVIGTLACRAAEQGLEVVIVFERQGHAATSRRTCEHAESDEGRHVVRRRRDREIHGRETGTSGGPAGAEG